MRQGDAPGTQFLGGLQTGRRLARTDIDLGAAGLQIALGDHLADAARTAGDQGDAPVE